MLWLSWVCLFFSCAVKLCWSQEVFGVPRTFSSTDLNGAEPSKLYFRRIVRRIFLVPPANRGVLPVSGGYRGGALSGGYRGSAAPGGYRGLGTVGGYSNAGAEQDGVYVRQRPFQEF